MHAVRSTFVEVVGAYHSLDSAEPHILSDIIAYTGESDGDALILQLLDEGKQLVASADVDEVY